MSVTEAAFDPRANTDREIQRISDDRLGRAGFARQIAERIVAAGKGPSIVYGLAGPWGGGKTSVLNMIGDVLAEEQKSKWSVVRFTPWSAADVDGMTAEFYRAIAEAMPPTNQSGRRAKQMLLAAAPVTAAIGKAALKGIIESKLGKGVVSDVAESAGEALAEQVGDIKVDPDPFIKRFDRLSALIKKANRQVLIVVDDIDRLHVDELLGVMKAVRLLGRFENVHYLLSYDQATVIDVLMASDLAPKEPTRAQRYLEKIVQYPFELPPIDPTHLAREFLAAMKAVLIIHHMLSSEDPAAQERAIVDILDWIPDKDYDELTIRFIHRLASQVDVLLTLVGHENDTELNFDDAVLITYLRLRYEPIYRQVPRWRRDLISDVALLGTMAGRNRTEPDWGYRIKKALETMETSTVDETRVEQVIRLLGRMFPRASSRSISLEQVGSFRIQDGEYFGRYFAFGMPVEDVADSRVRQELTALISTGSLPADSAIAPLARDIRTSNRIRRKIVRNLNILTSSPTSADTAAAAAHNLSETLYPSDLDYGRWAPVVYAILGNAISSANSVAAGRKVINKYADVFGLVATATVLASPTDLEAIDHSKIVSASSAVRRKIQDVCELDLTTDVLKENAGALTVLHFVGLLDSEQWTRLSEFSTAQIDSGKSKLHHLAARFVRVRERVYQGRPSVFDVDHYIDDYFAKVISKSQWDLTSVPEYVSTDVDTNDNSLTNRYKIAAIVLRQVYDGESAAGAVGGDRAL